MPAAPAGHGSKIWDNLFLNSPSLFLNLSPLNQIEECVQVELQLQTQITQVQMLAAMQNNSPQSPHQTSAEHDQLIRLKALTSFEASSSLLADEYEHKRKRAKLLQDAIDQK